MNILKKKKYYYFALFLLWVAVFSAKAQVGFQAKLETPPSFVSPYYEKAHDFSVAIYPQTYPYISYRLKHVPKVVTSNFKEQSIRFNTEYYRFGRVKKTLIPVSVDALKYDQFNRNKYINNEFQDYNRRSIVNINKKKGPGGLGVTIALPSRLNKIFGEGGAGLKVSGFKRVTFAGRSQWTDAAQTETYRQSKFPSLSMDQVSRFDITGTIGSKITVKVSQDDQTDIPLANRIQIRYKGDDDDILKSIEAGNTTLSLPNTKFVGYSSRIQGLFGIKAQAQVGHLTLTAIASQEKGSSESASYSPNGEESAQTIRDYEYVERRIFDLGRPGELAPNDSVKTLYVYESTDKLDDLDALDANLYVNPNYPDSFPAENVTGVKMNILDNNSYSFYNDPGRNLHYVVFNSARSKFDNLAYWMVVKRFTGDSTGVIDTIGNISSDTLKLKLLAPSDANVNPNQQTWGLMWRNCYEIPRGITIGDIDVKIFKGLDGTEGSSVNYDYQDENGKTVRYLEILGLDQYNTIDKKVPDNLLDDRIDIFRPDWGLLIFPSRTPFATDTTFVDINNNSTPVLKDQIPILYKYNSVTERNKKSEYYLQLSTKTRSSIIDLHRANIIEGSDRVTVNGRLLTRGTDYNIQYDFGRITLLSSDATDPNANISIDYEYAPFFAVQKKSLLGLRAEYAWSKDFKFGSTFLYKSDKAQERKPKVGEETAKMFVFDTDFSLKLHPNFLTKMADALPLIQTQSPSNLAISAEFAQSHPNPNVNGVAYVDDFEAALDQLSLGTSRTTWKRASKPHQLDSNYVRGKILWYTPRELVRTEDVYNIQAKQGEGTINTLRLIYRPKNIRIDTVMSDSGIVSSIDTVAANSWGGIMRYFNSRIDAQRVQLFEVRAHGSHGKLHFDFGRINEDLNGNDNSDSEDNPPRGDNNGAVDEYEDVGLDGLPDSEEPGYDPVTNPDPNGDDWYSEGQGKCPIPGGCDNLDWNNDSLYYEYLNGTEGNMNDPGVLGLPDKEALSTNGFNTNDAYFSYVIDFASDSFRVDGSDINGWRTYRIPIRDSAAVDDFVVSDPSLKPDWNQITHVRVWFEADSTQTDPDTIEVANWYFVQSNWQDSVVYSPLSDDSTKFLAASVSTEDSTFTPAPGVTAYTDPTSNVKEAQRALLLNFSHLNNKDSCLATKDLLSVDRYSGYRRLQMYVHGNIDPADTGKVKFFFRLGRDSKNYYEYHTMIYPGWDERNYVNIDFNDITALKDSAQRASESGLNVNVDDSVHYRVFGNPNINEIRYFTAGVVNIDTCETCTIDGELWIDELRVTDVRKDVGSAGRVSFNGNISDLLSYHFNYQSQDPYFRGISAATRGGSVNNLGSGKTQTNYNYGVTFNLNKFLPRSLGARLPVSLSYAKTIQTPLLRSNSDIVLTPDRRIAEQSVSETKSLNVSSSFDRKGKNPLFSLLLNRLKSKFSYSRTRQRRVQNPYIFSENYYLSSDFDLGIKKVPAIPIFFWTKPFPIIKKASGSKLFLYPTTWKTSGRYSRNLRITDDVNYNRTSSIQRDFNGNMKIGYKVFDNLNVSYDYQTIRDLSDLDLVHISIRNFKLGLETHYRQNFSASYDPKLFTFLTSTFSYKATYSDDWERTNKTRRSVLSRGEGVSGKFDHIAFLGGKKKSGSRRRFTRRGGTRAGRRTQKVKVVEKKKPFYDPPLAFLRFLTNWIVPISYSYNETYNNSLPGMAIRPEWKYRFGLRKTTDVPILSDVRSQSASEGKNYNLTSGFTLFGGLVTTVNYKRSLSRDLVKQGSRYENTSTSWPDLSIRIKKFTTLPLIKGTVNKFIDVFSPRTGFTRQTKETKDIVAGFKTSKITTKNYSPLLSVNFKLFRALSLSSTYSRNENKRENYNPTNGDIQSLTISTSKSLAITSQYSFSSPQGISLPLFGKVKFRSTVDIKVNVKINSSKTETSSSGGPFRPSVDKSDFSFIPIISYTFSQQIKGGLTVRWQDSMDNYRHRKNHTREVQLWTEIRF